MKFCKSGLLLILLIPTLTFAQQLLVPVSEYKPITSTQRFEWFARATVGPESLSFAGPWSAGWGTMMNSPEEYGPHLEGFAKRYGMRLTGISVGNAMQTSLGAAWGEDPRYFRSPQKEFGSRVKWVIATTFMAPHRDGTWHPAYAYYIGDVGNNFLSNTWRARSDNSAGDAAWRSVVGVGATLASHAFAEFFPDVMRKVRRRKD